ncbi:hypothetical protein D9619_008147 [Psilocybe cf. subviscida]|uniref:Uncharacterized protein n=1 Tax=Psilocybe cf. subviscida TaxID=2480587 RepID=A0A8H5AU98_9AGAR|nr:hypothetical protein D9619_008147 [Psilocybe cf. subviscida]
MKLINAIAILSVVSGALSYAVDMSYPDGLSELDAGPVTIQDCKFAKCLPMSAKRKCPHETYQIKGYYSHLNCRYNQMRALCCPYNE